MNFRQYRRYLLDLRSHKRLRPVLKKGAISYANWWNEDPDEAWFTRFIRYYWPEYNDRERSSDTVEKGKTEAKAENKAVRPVRFYSVFGPRSILDESFDGVKIFYSGENVEEYQRYHLIRSEGAAKALDEWRGWYRDYGCNSVRLSLGFADESTLPEDNSNYLRFPLWIMRFFDPEDGPEEIRKKIEAINAAGNREQSEEKMGTGKHSGTQFRHGMACIASHDSFGSRTAICDDLKSSGFQIQYAGNWRNNTSVLKTAFDDDKNAYLQTIRFNICPENTDTKDYVTEKLFDAFKAGTIPIYHGSLNQPEPGIINPNAVIFWEYDGDNSAAINLLQTLESDDEVWGHFLQQPKLFPAAADYVWDRLCRLKYHLEQLI